MFSVSTKKVIESNGKNQTGMTKSLTDIEDTASKTNFKAPVPTVTKRKRGSDKENMFSEDELNKTWREVLGNPPPIANEVRVDPIDTPEPEIVKLNIVGTMCAMDSISKEEMAISITSEKYGCKK